MINVFIDTSIFVAEGYVKGKSIATLFEAAQEEKIHILMPDITEYEIRRHLHEDVEKKSGRGHTEELKKSFMYAVGDLRKHIESLMAVDVDSLTEMVEKELDLQFSRADIERLSLPKGFDFAEILEDYKALKAPFSTKKKSEFPDAVALRQLEVWCKSNNETCVLLASDPDFKAYKSDCLEHKNLSEFVASLEEYEKMISPEKLSTLFAASKESMEEGIRSWIYEQYDDESLYVDYLLIVDIHDTTIKNVNVTWDEPLKWIGKEQGCLYYKTYASIVTSISVSHPDYETGYYDSEDQRWFFLNENVTDHLEGRIRIPVIIAYFYGVEEMHLESINNDDSLKHADLMESLVTTGERDFGDDDFEVDHMICPNCGAAVIIKEYSFPAVKIRMDEVDVFCPKCKQLLCTKPANNHYLAELLD